MFVRCAVLSALVASALCSLSEETSPENEAVEGVPADITDYPYQVSVQNKKRKHLCSGSLISDAYVVTAAHCVQRFRPTPKTLYIKAGSAFLNSTDGVTKRVARIHRHPEFNRRSLDHDIAVLELDYELDLGPTIHIIDLPDIYENVSPGTNMTVTGWGKPVKKDYVPKQLRKVDVSVMKPHDCKLLHRKGRQVTENMVCTGNSNENVYCSKDVGSPLVQDNILFGVVSWGGMCGDEENPTVYASVPALARFIEEITDQ